MKKKFDSEDCDYMEKKFIKSIKTNETTKQNKRDIGYYKKKGWKQSNIK